MVRQLREWVVQDGTLVQEALVGTHRCGVTNGGCLARQSLLTTTKSRRKGESERILRTAFYMASFLNGDHEGEWSVSGR